MSAPLAHLLRPQTFSEFVGQTHLVGPGKPITAFITSGKLPSLILWGPPGCGKTTLAHLIAKEMSASLIALSAIESGKEDVKKAIAQARETAKTENGKKTILFVDEIHRFNKAQQDALLKVVEEGTIILIATTTENPGFAVIPALVSRCHTYMLHPLSQDELKIIIQKTLAHLQNTSITEEGIDFLLSYASGDSRKIINALDLASQVDAVITPAVLESALQKKARYDKNGEDHFDTISAFIKSMRGNQPDATLHYLARMIEAGEDPMFIARRMVIFASEDIGNAQTTALVVAVSCMQAVHMIGMPEARILLAHCATYLATAKKSTASYDGIEMALADIKNMPVLSIPLHLRNASNKVSKEEGYGKDHVRYPWKEEKEGKKVDQEYMPPNLKGRKYYRSD